MKLIRRYPFSSWSCHGERPAQHPPSPACQTQGSKSKIMKEFAGLLRGGDRGGANRQVVSDSDMLELKVSIRHILKDPR